MPNTQTHKESIFYNGISPDPFMGPEGSFQYSENLDIRNDLNGVQLLPQPQRRGVDRIVLYVKFDNKTLVRISAFGSVSIGDNDSFTSTNIGTVPAGFPLGATKFRGEVYVFSFAKIYRFGISGGAMTGLTDITPPDRPTSGLSSSRGYPVINYWNSALLVGKGNKLWRGLPSTIDGPVEIGGWKEVRTFDKAEIRGIVGRSTNIEVYVDYNKMDSRIYYIGGFWDAEDTGVSDTVIFENLSIYQIGQLGQRVFVVCYDQTDDRTTYFYEVSGYNKRLIRKSTQDGGKTAYFDDFNFATIYQPLPAYGDMLFLPFKDGVWSHGHYEDHAPDALVKLWRGASFYTGVCFGPRLYASYIENSQYYEVRYPLSNRFNDFVDQKGVIISKIFTGNIREKKHLKRIRISYKFDTTDFPGPPETLGSISFFVRLDRSAYNITDGWVNLVTIGDTSTMVTRIEPHQIQQAGLSDFNVLERKIEITPGTYREVTPTFYDVEFEYDTVKD